MWENTSKDILEKMYSNKEDFKKATDFNSFASKRDFTPGYREKIDNNGIVGREIKIIGPETVALKDSDLPITLPDIEKYEPTGTVE